MRKDKATRKAEFKAAVIKQLKSLIGPVLILLVIVAAVAVILLWPDEEEAEQIIELRGFSDDAKEYVIENDELKLTMDAATTQFSVTVKDTGEVWYSVPQGVAEDPLALKTEKNKLQSTILLTYSNINGLDTLYNNYEHSMVNQLYEVEKGEDYIKIDYSIGAVEREYIVPAVIEADRYDAYMSQVNGTGKTMISQYYKKYDINNLSRSDEKIKDELLARYPQLATEVIYGLRDTATKAVKTKLEETFEALGYTYEEYLADKEKDLAEQTTDKPVYNLSVIYRLEGGDFVVEVPYESIEYPKDYPIYKLSVLPYFGAAGTTDEGYLFVPEGGGALIGFNNNKVSSSAYYAELYGWDMCLDRDAIVHETRVMFGAFGEMKGNSSYLCMIEQGAPYAAIQADISGKSNSYNYVNAVYTLLHREQYDVSDKYNGNMFVYEKTLPEGEGIKQRYHFVNSGDYVDVATEYQKYLFGKYEGEFTETNNSEAPVVIEVVGAVDKVKQILGVPVSRPLELTSFAETEEVLRELMEAGMREVSVKMTGWINGGVQQQMLSKVKIVKDLGGKKALKSLIATAGELGVTVYLNGITNYAIDSNIFDGFFVFRDAARFISKEKAELYEYSTTSYGKRDDLDKYYLLKEPYIKDMVQNLTDAAVSYGTGVSFEDVGKVLSSDFTRKALVTRQKVLESQTEQLKAAEERTEIMINSGNDYAVPFADMVTNMKLEGSKYTIIDKTIPFYQLALHGYVNYTGESLNLTKDMTQELLKSAEYGAGLQFTIMKESSFTLQNTLYTEYFGAEYDSCKESILAIYNRYNEELGHVFNQKMTNHVFEKDSVTCTTYEDGTKVYVNYSYDDVTVNDGTIVPARDYKVVK